MSQVKELKKLINKVDELIKKKEEITKSSYVIFYDEEGRSLASFTLADSKLHKAMAIKMLEEQIENYLERINREFGVNLEV